MRKALIMCLSMMFLLVGQAIAQDRLLVGEVVDRTGEPLPGVTVVVKGTSTGVVTDIDGMFKVNIPTTGATLTFSYIGYATQDVIVTNEARVKVELAEGALELDEVVVTSFGEREKKAIGYSVQQVDGEALAQTREPNIINALQGQVAGVQIQGTQSSLGGSSRITIRGSNSFLGDNQPLFIVDGVPISNSNFASAGQQRGFGGGGAYDYGNAISDINPADIRVNERAERCSCNGYLRCTWCKRC